MSEALRMSDISAEGQYYAYVALLDYESNVNEAPEDAPGIKVVYEEELAVASLLEGTDYIHFPSRTSVVTVLGSWHGLAVDELRELMYQAMFKGFDPPVELAEKHTSDFMWDELLNGDVDPQVGAILGSSSFYGSNYGESIPLDVHPGGHVMTRLQARWILGKMFDTGHQYRDWGWGYPDWSRPDELAEALSGAEAIA